MRWGAEGGVGWGGGLEEWGWVRWGAREGGGVTWGWVGWG